MLRRFKKACDRKGIVQECRDRQYFTKPNDKESEESSNQKKEKLDGKSGEQRI